MSEISSNTNPKILVNHEELEQQEDTEAATLDEQVSTVYSLDDKCSEEKESQAKMQSVLQQVRQHIRSQAGTKAAKSSIAELVKRVKEMEMEMAQVNSEPEGKDVNSEEKKEAVDEMMTDDSKDEMDVKEEEPCACFEGKLEATKKALRDEFDEQISQVRTEMQAYTAKALRDLECKMRNWESHIHKQSHPKEEQESKGPDRRQRPPVVPSLAARRGRVLTRTMTTIIPKTCPPVIIGPRAKSETLASSKGGSSRLLPRGPAHSLPGSKPYQSLKPLPPTCPPLHQCKKTICAKVKTGK